MSICLLSGTANNLQSPLTLHCRSSSSSNHDQVRSIRATSSNINIPGAIGRALLSKSQRSERFELFAELKLTLDFSKLDRRTFSALVVVTAVCLIGSPALAAYRPDNTLLDDGERGVPEYGPQLPKKSVPLSSRVFLARVARMPKQDCDNEEEEEVLELSLEVPRSGLTALDVFINLPDANLSSSTNLPEFVGSFRKVGGGDVPGQRLTKARFGISDKIKLLGLEHCSSLLVAVVRRGKTPVVSIQDVDVHCE